MVNHTDKNRHPASRHHTAHTHEHALSEADTLMDAEIKQIEEAKIRARNEHLDQIYEAAIRGERPKEPYRNEDDIRAYKAGLTRYEEIHNAPYKNDGAAKALRWAAIPASIVPGLGAALNGAATGLIVHEAENRKDPESRIHELEACGATSTALSLLPVAGAVGAITSAGIGAGLTSKQLVHDIRHGQEERPELCHNLILDAVVEPALGVKPVPTPTAETAHNAREKKSR